MLKKYLSLLPIFLIALLCAVAARADWQDPTGAPPGNNQPRPLNVGLIAQEKTGPLILSHASNALILRDQSPLLFGNPTGNTVGFRAPSGLGASTLWTLPIADGTNGTVLTTNGAGQLSWTTPTVAATATVDLDWRYEGTSENFTSIYSEKLTRVGSGGTRNYATGDGDLYVQNKLEVDNGLYIGGLTTGSVVFQGSDGKLTQDNINFIWDESNQRLTTRSLRLAEPLLTGDGWSSNKSGVLYLGNYPAMHFSGVQTFFTPVRGHLVPYSNTFVGYLSGLTPLTSPNFQGFVARGNTAVGYNTLYRLEVGTENTAIGASALSENKSGNKNTAIGTLAMRMADISENNTALGAYAMYSGQGSSSTYLGFGAGYDAKGSDNVLIGYMSGHQLNNPGGNSNVFLGNMTGYSMRQGSNNVFLGNMAGSSATSGNRRLYIEASSGDKNNALIYGQFFDPDNASASPLLRFNGKVGIAPRGDAVDFEPNKLLHIYSPGGDNAEINIQSVGGPGQHWGIYHDRADLALKFWHLGVNRLVVNDQGLSVSGNLTVNGQRGFTGYTCQINSNNFPVRYRYESGLLICVCTDTGGVCPGVCTCSNPQAIKFLNF